MITQTSSQSCYHAVITVGGWNWILYVQDPDPTVPIVIAPVVRVVIVGGVIGTLFVLFIWSLARTRDRANTYAQELTASLRESEQRYALAVHGSNDGLWDWDLTTGKVYYAPRWKELLGLTDEQVGDRPEEWFGRITSNCLTRFHAELTRHIKGETERFDTEIEMHHANGSIRWMLCRAAAVRDESGSAVRIAGSLTDITDLKYAQNELHSMAHHDQLTGLANRLLLTDRLNHAIARTRRNPDYHCAVLFLDFDRFKVINDSLGHDIGDGMLKGIAQRICQNVREVDTVARFGGDEFVVLLDGVRSEADVQMLSKRLLDILARPFTVNTCEVASTVSIGVVNCCSGYQSADEVIRDADAAMYQAKAAGRARFCLFDAQMHTQAVRRMNLEQNLRQCDYDQQFQLHYQPIVCLNTGKTTAFEALVRWNHPEFGLIPPDEFISLAEETGHIIPLGKWILNQACLQMVKWRTQFSDVRDMCINVNLSRRQLMHTDLIQVIRDALDRTGLPPGALKLEVTESTVMDNTHAIVSVMKQIRDLGVRLAMDDFGTGHSSLSCLYQFPIEQLKIDRSFVVNMQLHKEFVAVMDAIITLACHLHLEVVAEGIENADQLALLQGMSCSFGQGYHFAKPMPISATTEYLAGVYANAA